MSANRKTFRGISLLTALSLLTTAAAVAALIGAWRKNADLVTSVSALSAENRKLRAEQGALTVDDPAKVYAIRLPDLIDDVWRYRVYLPPGRDYYLATQVNKLPLGEEPPRFGKGDEGPPNLRTICYAESTRGGRQSVMGQAAGEILVTFQLYTNETGQKAFKLHAGVPGGGGKTSGFAMPEIPGEWPAIEKAERKRSEPPIGLSRTGVPTERQVEEPAENLPLVLLDYRVMHSGVTSSDDSDEGVLVWVGRADEREQP